MGGQQDEYKLNSADRAFIGIVIISFVIGISYFTHKIYLSVISFFYNLYIPIGYYLNKILLSISDKLDFYSKYEMYYKMLKKGYFDKIFLKQMPAGQNLDGDLIILSQYKAKAFAQSHQIFYDMYFINIIIFSIITFLLLKIIKRKKRGGDITIYKKTLMAYEDKIVQLKERKGHNGEIMTNDHQPPVISTNSDYITDSIKYTFMWEDKEFHKEVKRILQKREDYLSATKSEIDLNKKEKINLEKDEAEKINIEDEIYIDGITEKEHNLIKTYNLIKKYSEVSPQYNQIGLVDKIYELNEKKRKKSRLTILDKEFNKYVILKKKELFLKKGQKLEDFEKEIIEAIGGKVPNFKEKPILKKQEKLYIKKIENKYLENFEKLNPNYPEGSIYTPFVYILHNKKGKKPRVSKDSKSKPYTTKGIDIIFKLLFKYILEEYEENIKKEIDELTKQNKTLNPKNEKDQQSIDRNNEIIAENERRLDHNTNATRKNKIMELERHFEYEETYALALWEYANTLQNMPTGPLAILKRKNPPLWYAFTSQGRPSCYTAGSPIFLMFMYEKEKYEGTLKFKESETGNELETENFSDYLKEIEGDKFLKDNDLL